MQLMVEKATRQHTKDHNSRLVFRTIFEQGEVSRADLARMTRLTRTTISEVVGDLIERGLVEEIGLGPSAGGRSPILVRIAGEGRHVIGLSLTSNAVHAALISLRGETRLRDSLALAQPDGEAAIAAAYELIDSLVQFSSSPIIGIGLSTPGVIDTASGIVRRAVHFDWHDLPLGDMLQRRYGVPVYIANDSHTAALAEYTFGAGHGRANLLAIRIGQGIGAGIVLGGQLFLGDGFGAGEIGHVRVVEEGETCKCGNRGCLETVASVPALLRRAQAAAPTAQGYLGFFAKEPHAIDLEVLSRALQANDPTVSALIADVGRYLGIAVANIIGLLNIQRIVITGRIATLGEPLAVAVRNEAQHRVLPALAAATEIVVTPQGSDGALRGASALLLAYELGVHG